MIDAGELTCPIIITVQSTTTDAYNAPLDQWLPVLQTWAKIALLTSKEVYALGSGRTDQSTHKITIRYPRVPIKAKMQIAFRGNVYKVQLVNDPDMTRTRLDLICEVDQ